ncbi:hypothetical protein MALV_47820 [Mycolicibacterium alvei]|uniref:Uncharacterized protein n=1 Tax=Mycolicibacterium alvei TaxID=67081 RepID=A0A6N4V1C4_9MYCO|nr:hypothetical protein MALV_47820 [Mycolicibacterium alvei]
MAARCGGGAEQHLLFGDEHWLVRVPAHRGLSRGFASDGGNLVENAHVETSSEPSAVLSSALMQKKYD